MAASRDSRIEQICLEALSVAPMSLDDFLRTACGDDHDLLSEVASLLRRRTEAEHFLTSPLLADTLAYIGSSASTLVGQTLGAYRIDAFLGAGGMGEVYRARDTSLGRDVALKVLPSPFTADPEPLARFERR